MTLDIAKLLDCKIWSDKQVVDILKELTENQFNTPQIDNFNSLHSICIHLVHEIRHWYLFLKNETQKIQIFDDLSKNKLLDAIIEYDEKISVLYNSIKNQPYQVQWQKKDKIMHTTSEEIIFNWINHGSYHRGQIVAVLRMLGMKVEMTDYFPYTYSNLQNTIL